MQIKTKLKIIAVILIIYGVCRFLPLVKLYKHFLEIKPLANLLLNILDMLIFPLGFIIGGVFLFRLKGLGRTIIFLVLIFDLAIRLFAIVNFWYQAIKILPTISASGDINVSFPFAWPMHIIAALELVSLIYLAHPKIRERFE
jgi:hypothetical protein